MRKIIYLRTLPHLDQPVISRLQVLLQPDITLENFNFYGRFDFDLAKDDEGPHFSNLEQVILLRNQIFNTKLKSSKELIRLVGRIVRFAKVLRLYQFEMLRFLHEQDPSFIFVASDHNFTLDLISKSNFMEKVVIIQPALITHRRPAIKLKIKNLFYRAVNNAFQLPIYNLGHNWGDRKYKSKYLLWSQLESQSRLNQNYLCGDLFMENIKEITFKESTTLKSILVILPSLSLEKIEVREKYIRALSIVGTHLRSTLFVLRWHPSDLPLKYFEDLENFCDFNQYISEENGEFNYVISSVSALAINLRRKTENVLIFHPGEYGDLGGHYITSDYFKICGNHDDILSVLNGECTNKLRDFSNLFRLDDTSVTFLKKFCNLPN